ncbi:MAG: hypothetical protein ACOYPR_15470, partial [Saprospiraceae bacterium]
GSSTQKTILITPSTLGTYTLTATNTNGCTSTDTEAVTIIIPIPPVLINPSITPETGAGASNGAVNISVGGGTPPYTYLWSNGATTEDLINIPSGMYTLLVSDANDCTVTVTVNVPLVSNAPVLPDQLTAFTLQPNPSNGPVTVDLRLKTAMGVQMEIWSTDGRLLQTRPVDAALHMREVFETTPLTAGAYLLKVRLADGSMATKPFVIQ